MPAATADRLAIRDRLTASLSWSPARVLVKRGVHLSAGVRGQLLRAERRLPPIANIFAASCPKSGSQWIKAVFHHPVVRAHTRLLTLPQLDYQIRRPAPFPAGTFVPGVYLSYADYQRIPKPLPYRTVYIFRDPRDILVSGYFSQLETHPEMFDLAERRQELQKMSMAEGLLYALRTGESHIRDMATWVDVSDSNVGKWRLEDVATDPAGTVRSILAHCDVELSDAELDRVLTETSRDALQQKDLAHRKAGSESHYRVERKGFRDLFGPEHYAAVEQVVPGLIEKLGYPE